MTALDWQWTNDAHTTARADRWTVTKRVLEHPRVKHAEWAIRHDDFPESLWDLASTGGHATRAEWAKARIRDFLAWLASQPVTLEHREGEYVHFKCDANTHYQFVDGAWRNPDYPRVPVTVRDIEDWNARIGVTAHGFLTPGTITKAAPAEPTGFGYVGHITDTDGTVGDVIRRDDAPHAYSVVWRHGGEHYGWIEWLDVLAGDVTFTAVTS